MSVTHSITCHLTQVNTPCLNPNQILPTPEGLKAELIQVTRYTPRWFTRRHPSTNLAVHTWELNSPPVDYKLDALSSLMPLAGLVV